MTPPCLTPTEQWDRFEARLEQHGDCLVWTGALDANGYGRCWDGDRAVLAHRYAWEHWVGPIPVGKYLDHTRWTTACVSPGHLREATPQQNMQNREGSNRNSRSGIRGVSRLPNGKWRARAMHERREHHFGTHDTQEEAEQAAIRGREGLYGDRAGGRK